jgi:hypothetical protein
MAQRRDTNSKILGGCPSAWFGASTFAPGRVVIPFVAAILIDRRFSSCTYQGLNSRLRPKPPIP